jgi:autotransporter-associated beta strand protein
VRLRSALLASTALIAGASLGLGASAAHAQSATWAGPGADWDTTANWSPAGVPTATAIFTGATPTSITFSAAATSIGTMQFNAGAPAYTFTQQLQPPGCVICTPQSLTINGTGVVNNSSNAPTFVDNGGGTINFLNSATAGNANIQMHEGTLNFENTSNAGTATITTPDAMHIGIINFHDQSSAASANITMVGSLGITPGEQLNFLDRSTAGNATITNNPGLGAGGNTVFGTLGGTDTADAGTAHITNNGLSVTDFLASTSAKNATITNNTGGDTNFQDQSTAGNATIVNNFLGTTNFGIPFVGTDTATAGNANITNNADGLTQFNAATTAGNATITNNSAGILQFGSQGSVTPGFEDTATAGNSTITNNFATVIFNSATTAGNANITNSFGFIFFNDVASAGNSTISDSGSITFADSTTAGSANITMHAGVLSFADNSTAGNATITTNAGSQVQFTDSSSGGTARFILNNGIFDISGLTSGGMTAGSIEGSGSVFLGGNALTVGGNNLSTTFSGAIQDGGRFGGIGGSLVKTGMGTLILSGTNSYTGATTINQGMLQLDGTTASEVVVNSGGTFSGDGVVDVLGRSLPANVTISSGGVFAPGLPGQPGTFMTIDGSLAFRSGAIYLVQLNPSSTTYVMVNGAVTLAGTVEAFFAPGSYIVPKTYEILQSFDRTGTFSSVVTVPPNFQANLTYDPRNVFLNLTAILGLGGNLTVNQNNVATALNNFFNNGGTLPPNFSTVFELTGPALANALNQIDGEASVDAEATAFKSMDQFLALMLDPFVNGRTGSSGGGALGFAPDQPASFPPDIALAYDSVLKAPPKPAGFDQRWTAWGAAYGGSSNTNGDPAVIGSTSFTAQTYGFAAGMDRHISPDLVAGFALAGGGTHWDLAQAMGGGRSDAFQVGAYATKYFGPAYVAADIAFANHWMTTSRTAFAGDQLTANFNAQSYGGRIEAGYRYALPATWSVTPYGALQVQNFHTPQYSETDLTGGGFGLSYNAMSAYDTRGELGARFDEPTTLYGMPLTLRARLAWAHDWVNGPALQAVFETLPGANFIVNGAAIPKNSALTTAGAELHLTQAWSLLAKFDGEFAKGSQTYAGTGTLRYVW